MSLTINEKLEALVHAGVIQISGAREDSQQATVYVGTIYTYRAGVPTARFAAAIDEAFSRHTGGTMTSTAQKLDELVRSGDVVLSGKQWGGAGRSIAVLGGRSYSYTGRRLTKILGAAVDRLYHARPPNPIVIGDLVGDDGEDNRKPSRTERIARRAGVLKIQRAVRRRIAQSVRERNAYVHQLVEGLRAINRGDAKKLVIDLRRVKVKALRQLIINNVASGKRLAIKLPNGTSIFLNDRTLQRLSDGLVNEKPSSDKASDEELVELKELADTIELIVISDGRKRPAGAFFRFTHRTGFDWCRYGIFPEVNPENYHDSCLFLALEAGGLPEEKLERLKLMLLNRYVAKCKLKEICAALEISIKLKTVRADVHASRQEVFGQRGAPVFELGLVDDHFFIKEPVEVTHFALKHYDRVCHEPNYHCIASHNGRQWLRDERKFIDSFRLFKVLLENQETLLTPITHGDAIHASKFYREVREFGSLDYTEKNLRSSCYEPKKGGPAPYRIYFDFETVTSGERHEPYLVRYETEHGLQREFRGKQCGLDMLRSIARLPGKDDIALIAHNSNYDARFLMPFLDRQTVIEKSGRFLSVSGVFLDRQEWRYVWITIRDSYRMIDMPLRQFGKSFGLTVEKEIMPYSLFTSENVERGHVPIDEALVHVSEQARHAFETSTNLNRGARTYNEDLARSVEEAKEHFMSNVERWGCLSGDNFDLIQYSSEYCRIDCKVLHLGYEVFRGWMMEHTQLDPAHYITLQSLAADYMLKEGCHDGVSQLSGVPQAFISRCVIGGRVMANSNQKCHVEGKVTDYDACSLYPSAMRRLGGYLMGAPKVLAPNQLEYEFLCRQDGYFVDIRVTRVKKHRQFPLAPLINDESGTRDWTNALEGHELHLDKTGLEDLIRWQGVEFEVLRGYYFDEGRNDQLGHCIQHLYDVRRRLKREGNPAQLVFKLLMNSAYGRTILKPIESDTVVIPEAHWESFASLNYQWIERAQKVGERYYAKQVRGLITHFNYVHAGVEVLSTSKRIMNEVMCLAEDEGHVIYYQDTDSIHLNSDAVPELAKAYKRVYNRELDGEDMGEFHVDLDLPGAVGEVYAKESLFLGKKTYLHVLEGIDKNGNSISGYHIRMKGVPSRSIRHTADKAGISVLDVYRRLYGGSPVSFDLTCGGQSCGFKYQKDLSVRSYKDGEFVRTLRFEN